MEIKQELRNQENIEPAKLNLDLAELSSVLNIVDVRILKHFYCPEPTPYVFRYLYRKFIKYGWKEHMIRNRLRRLAKMGLLKIVPKTNPLCILPVKEYENHLKLLVMAMLGRFDLVK